MKNSTAAVAHMCGSRLSVMEPSRTYLECRKGGFGCFCSEGWRRQFRMKDTTKKVCNCSNRLARSSFLPKSNCSLISVWLHRGFKAFSLRKFVGEYKAGYKWEFDFRHSGTYFGFAYSVLKLKAETRFKNQQLMAKNEKTSEKDKSCYWLCPPIGKVAAHLP